MTSPVLRRASAQREVLVLAAVVLLVSVVLVTACGIALRVATESGVAAGLDRSAPTDRVVLVSGNPEDADGLATADRAVRDLLSSSLAPAKADVQRRTVSATYAVQGGAEGDRLVLGAYDGARDHARLVAGDWPAGGSTTRLAVPEAAADALDLAPGDPLVLQGQDGRTLRAEVSGVWVADDPTEGWWAGDTFGATGVREGGGFRTFGPLFLADDVPDGAMGLLVDPRVSWLAEPALTSLSGDELRGVAARLDRISEDASARLGGDLPDPEVVTGLDDVLRTLGPALSAARTAVLVPTLLLLALALTSLVLAARVVADARAADVALRESRGFSRGQVLRESGAEMLALGLVVLAAAPWLAPPLVRAVVTEADAPGATGLRGEDWLWAAVTVLVGVVLLTRAASASLRPQRVTTGWRRLLPSPRQVVEVLAVVLALVAWQQSGGAPASDGSGVLVRAAAPVLVVAALLLVLARLVPLASRAGGAGLARARGIVTSVVTWDLSRRSEQQRAALVTIGLATAVTVLLAGLVGSWSDSQDEQAAVTTGADVRVSGLRTAEATTLAEEAGGTVVERRAAGIGTSSGTVVVVAREDLARVLSSPTSRPWPDLLARLAPDAARDGKAAVPVLVSPAVSRETGDGGRLSLRLADTPVAARVVGVLPAFPGAEPGESAVMVDAEALTGRLGAVPGPAVSTDDTEVWAGAGAAAAASDVPGATVLDRSAVAERLRSGPVGTGLLAGSVLALVAAAMLGLLAAVSETASALRTRRGELAALRAQGLSRGALVTTVGLERGILTLGSVLLGALVGWGTLRLLLDRLVVGDTGLLPNPAAQVAVPWPLLLAGVGVAVAALTALVLGSAARVARRPLGDDLREAT